MTLFSFSFVILSVFDSVSFELNHVTRSGKKMEIIQVHFRDTLQIM